MKSQAHELLLAQIKERGLPAPQSEYRFAPPRRWKFDLAWPADMLAVEVEGSVYARGRHTRGAGYTADCEKYNAAALLGWKLLRFTTAMVLDNVAIDVIERALSNA